MAVTRVCLLSGRPDGLASERASGAVNSYVPPLKKITTSWPLMSLEIGRGIASRTSSRALQSKPGRVGVFEVPKAWSSRWRENVTGSPKKFSDNLRLQTPPPLSLSLGLCLLSGENLIVFCNEGYPSSCRRIRHPVQQEGGRGADWNPLFHLSR